MSDATGVGRSGNGERMYSQERQDGSPAVSDGDRAVEGDASGDEQIQVLEFELGTETYCVEIDYVSEIVDRGSLTAVPNAPHYVDGVMDLRGRTTSIVDPKSLLNVAGDAESKRIVIFDPDMFEDEAAIGWVVDEVYQVFRVSLADVEAPPMDHDEAIRGIVKRDGGLIVWISPIDAMD